MKRYKVNYTRYGKQRSVTLEATNESDAFDEMFDMASQGELGVTEESDPWLEEIE
jgi:dsDNA-binding SOS-regulon protein|tara:strand:- start:491 stop:655 length:165 start_codon:yes stop_codon:yes gene_type:complete